MPAIHPARMKIRVAELSEKLLQPVAFVRALHQILDDYADRTYRPGQTGEPPPLLATYKTPVPVFRQIDREIATIAESDPTAALALVDALWDVPAIEFRLLATSLLGRIRPVPWTATIQRIQSWISTKPEDRIAEAILENGLRRIRVEFPNIHIQLVEDWLKAEQTYLRQIGLRALIPVLEDPHFDNLPAVLRILTPFIRIPPPPLRQDLVAVLRVLAQRFPQEASYIFRQNLSDDRPDTAWLVRQALNDLPLALQNTLREALR